VHKNLDNFALRKKTNQPKFSQKGGMSSEKRTYNNPSQRVTKKNEWLNSLMLEDNAVRSFEMSVIKKPTTQWNNQTIILINTVKTSILA
jgi:hypothetical protein